jgi:hypothetical protein
MTLPIPNPFGTVSTQKIKSQWTNNLQANTYVAPYGQMFFDTYDGVLRLGDGSTPGGQIIITGGGGNGIPSGPDQSVQFNNSGVFGGNIALTFNAANSVLTLTGNIQTSNIVASNNAIANAVFAANGLFFNSNVIPESITLPAGYNAMSSGVTLIPDDVIVEVGDGQRWTAV